MTKDQIRKLQNFVTLNGKLAELSDSKEGHTKEGVPTFSFGGRIQCSEDDPTLTVRFKCFVKAKKADGTVSENFKNVKAWYESAVPMLLATEEKPATKVKMIGSVVDNPYVSSQHELVEDNEYRINAFKPFDEALGYTATIELEGFVGRLEEEEVRIGEDDFELTGRLAMTLYSTDIFGNLVKMDKLFISKEMVPDFKRAGYEADCTADFMITLASRGSNIAENHTGFGVRMVPGKARLEKVVTWGSEVEYREGRMIEPEVIKTALKERDIKLQQIKEAGYLGNKTASVSPKATGFGAAASPATDPENPVNASVITDEDIPF